MRRVWCFLSKKHCGNGGQKRRTLTLTDKSSLSSCLCGLDFRVSPARWPSIRPSNHTSCQLPSSIWIPLRVYESNEIGFWRKALIVTTLMASCIFYSNFSLRIAANYGVNISRLLLSLSLVSPPRPSLPSQTRQYVLQPGTVKWFHRSCYLVLQRIYWSTSNSMHEINCLNT